MKIGHSLVILEFFLSEHFSKKVQNTHTRINTQNLFYGSCILWKTLSFGCGIKTWQFRKKVQETRLLTVFLSHVKIWRKMKLRLVVLERTVKYFFDQTNLL